MSEYATKVIENMFSNAIFKSLIEKWLIYHMEKELNHFGLKKGFLISQKLKFLKKIFLLETVHVILKYHLLKYFNTPTYR